MTNHFKQFQTMLWFALCALSLLGRYPLTSIDIHWQNRMNLRNSEKLKLQSLHCLQCLQCRRAMSCSPPGPCCLCINRGCATPWWFGDGFKAGVSKGSKGKGKIDSERWCVLLEISGDTPDTPSCRMCDAWRWKMMKDDKRWWKMMKDSADVCFSLALQHHSSFWWSTKRW